ncbi:MAG: GAF domain-containing sensor histidine kinase [Anaerolineales bacterium]|nr:GAF domain-containing sensor histidine kinase [Anaerolineales bacterium]
MRQSISNNLIHWTIISMRWLTTIGLAISLTAGDYSYWLLGIFLFIVCAWNIFHSVVIILNKRLFSERYLIISGDIVFALVLFIFTGAYQGRIFWVGIMPLFSATLYFSYQGGLILAFANTIMQGLIGALINEPRVALIYMIVLLVVYLGIGAILGYSKGQLNTWLEYKKSSELDRRQKPHALSSEHYGSINEIISALGTTLNYERVLEIALDVSASALSNFESPDDRLAGAVLLYSSNPDESDRLVIESARRLTPADMRVSLPGVEGLIGQALTQGEACYGLEPEKDAELQRIVAFRSCDSMGCLPIRLGLEAYGVLVYAHPEADYFTDDRKELLNIICNQVVNAIQNARLYNDLELEKERMMEIQEDARKKLARDLHDGPTQSVSALALRVNYARRLIERDTDAAAEELYKVEELARRTTKEIRHMLFTLRPLVLESQGLIAAFESMAEKMRETYEQNVIIQADPNVIPKLEPGKQAVVFYIGEEAVNNARKHAQAPHVWVRLKLASEGIVVLEIEDDGVGFNVGEVNQNYENRSSLGMVNMRERTELVNGVIQVNSEKGKGTLIRVFIPTTEEAADQLRLNRDI